MNAYISNDLNMVKELDPMRHELVLQMEAFLNKGGTIQVLPFWVDRDEPQKPNTITPNFQTQAVKDETDKQAARIRQMAKTMNRVEICLAESISLGVLRGIARRYSITFKVGAKNNIAPNKFTPAQEALLVVRIKECIAKGVSRNQCSVDLGISSTLLFRLIDDYQIDYPKRT